MSAKQLDPLDLYDIRSELSEDEVMVKETVGRFVDDRAIPLMLSIGLFGLHYRTVNKSWDDSPVVCDWHGGPLPAQGAAGAAAARRRPGLGPSAAISRSARFAVAGVQ